MEDLQDQIVSWLAQDENAPVWHAKAVITDERKWEYVEAQKVKIAIADTVSRKLRLAEESKRIARRDSGKSCEYRFLPPEHRERYIPWSLREDKSILFRVEGQEDAPKKRTAKQNDSLHLYLSQLAQELNDSGQDMRKVLKPTVDIPWSTDTAKRFLWKPIQKVMVDKESTTDLTTDEVDKIYRVLDRHVSEKCGLHVPFPSVEETESYLQSLEQKK